MFLVGDVFFLSENHRCCFILFPHLRSSQLCGCHLRCAVVRSSRLPATAPERGGSVFMWSWDLSKKNGWAAGWVDRWMDWIRDFHWCFVFVFLANLSNDFKANLGQLTRRFRKGLRSTKRVWLYEDLCIFGVLAASYCYASAGWSSFGRRNWRNANIFCSR